MKQIAKVDIQQEKPTREAAINLIKYCKVGNGNIGLENLYSLIDCNLVERITLGDLGNNESLDLIFDEEGKLNNNISRGISIKDNFGRVHEIMGNSLFVKSTLDGDWVGWEDQQQMADDIRKFTASIKLFDLV